MARIRSLLLAIAASVSVVTTAGGITANAADQPISVQRAQEQVDTAQARLNQLNDQVEQARGKLDLANRTLDEDAQKQAHLDVALAELARYQYTQPSLPVQVMRAGSIGEMLGDLAQARVVSSRQEALLKEQKAISARDQQARDEIAKSLAAIQKAQAEAKDVAEQAKSTLASAQAAQAAAMQAQVASMSAQAAAINSGASAGNHFAYGYCTWYVANRRPIPWFGNAIEWWPNARAYGYAEGQTPQVGAVMVTRESGAGHVAYVESVNGDGSWTVSEMNYVAWGVVSRRTLRPGQAPVVGFIYGKA